MSSSQKSPDAHPYKKQLGEESNVSEYDIPPDDEKLPSTILNWPATHSQMKMWEVTRAQALAQWLRERVRHWFPPLPWYQ